ncbi:MAG TPA: antitoxin [Dermatophilaceae bacterium]|nr:antitoxin [Dermatophilaceae bacterium]
MKFSDLKAKAEQLGVDKAARRASEKAAELAAKNKDTVGTWVDKAATTVDSKTGGKYADKVEKVKGGVTSGVDKLAAQAPSATTPADAASPMGATPPVDPVAPAHPAHAAPSAHAVPPVDSVPPVDAVPPVDPASPAR